MRLGRLLNKNAFVKRDRFLYLDSFKRMNKSVNEQLILVSQVTILIVPPKKNILGTFFRNFK